MVRSRPQHLRQENFHLANVDSLTDLPNQHQFFHRLSLLAEREGTEEHTFVVGVLDLDGFKAVRRISMGTESATAC